MNASGRSASRAADFILWDVVEEHLNEAEFLLEQFERAVRSPAYTLRTLSTTIEPRLAAHIDGLVVGGDEVAARLLLPELQNADVPARATVAALALLCGSERGAIARVLDAVQDAAGALQHALTRAVVLSDAHGLDELLVARFADAAGESGKAVWLEVLAGRETDPGVSLRRWLASDDPRVNAAALQFCGRFPKPENVAIVERHLQSGDARVRMHALRASLALKSRTAWELCRQWVKTCGDTDVELLSIYAMFGGQAENQLLVARLEQAVPVEHLLWTLGFCGTPEAGDACLIHLRQGDERAARAAADSLSWIGGFPLIAAEGTAEPSEHETLPPFDEDNLDVDLGLDGIDDLPTPDREAMARSWGEHRSSWGSHPRHLLGLEMSSRAFKHALQEGPLWRRHDVAFELLVRTDGERRVSTNAFSTRQRRQLAALEANAATAR